LAIIELFRFAAVRPSSRHGSNAKAPWTTLVGEMAAAAGKARFSRRENPAYARRWIAG